MLHTLRTAAQIESTIDAALRPLDLTADRWRALTFVTRHPGSSMADLIEALAMPSTSATRTVDALVEVGALFRSPHPHDRRRVTLHVSAPGKRLLRSATAALTELFDPAAIDLSDGAPSETSASAVTPVP